MTILLVCTANICRSPYAAGLFHNATLSKNALAGLVVVSAGTNAVAGQPICERVAHRLIDAGLSPKAVAARTSRVLTPTRIRRAQLVLTAGQAHRSASNRLVPGSQARTFTLLEAAALAGHLTEVDSNPARVSLEDAVRQLNAARGLIPELTERRSRSFRSSSHDPLSIVDGHTMSSRAHTAALTAVEKSANTIIDFLDRRVAPSEE